MYEKEGGKCEKKNRKLLPIVIFITDIFVKTDMKKEDKV